MSGGRWKMLAGMAVVLAVATVLVVIFVVPRRRASAAVAPPQGALANPDIDPGTSAGDIPAPGFTLVDEHGKPTSLAQFRGKVVVLTFVDWQCTTICPLTTESMVQALRLLGPAASQVQLLGINANPTATSVKDVATYTREHHLQAHWHFLTGPKTQLEKVWRGYHVYVAAIQNDIDHTPLMVLIDPQGRERTIYLTQMSYEGVAQQAQILARDIARLLPQHPAFTREVALNYVKPFEPESSINLPTVGAKSQHVTLGKGQPHLLLFFAGWLQEQPKLSARLAELQRYAATAQSSGLPLPVAVDAVTTEASSGDLRDQLAALSAKHHLPIVEDSDGRIADGYGVQDLPWYVLTSPTGKIVWHHDGWLSAEALARQVRANLTRS